MKRLHVRVCVDDLAASTRFYGTLFAAAPTVIKPDYAKWMLDDPRANFAISTHGSDKGLDHFGIQVETPEELDDVYDRLRDAAAPCSRKAIRPAVMRSPKRPGSAIPRVCRGTSF